jgi:hypothetical protein
VTGKAMRSLLVVVLLAGLGAACGSRPALSFGPDSLPNATIDQPYSVVISVSGNETPVGDIYASGQLPPGLTLEYDQSARGSAAELRGTPTVSATYQFTVSAWCLGTNVSGQTGSRQFTLTVIALPI